MIQMLTNVVKIRYVYLLVLASIHWVATDVCARKIINWILPEVDVFMQSSAQMEIAIKMCFVKYVLKSILYYVFDNTYLYVCEF